MLPEPDPQATPGDLITVYSSRGAVPQQLWMSVFERAKAEIAILAYSAIWLPEQNLALVPLLRRRAEDGCRVRIALGDPMSEKLQERRLEERTGRGIQDRVQNALTHYRPLRTVDGVSLHIHATTLYSSIFRRDDEMLVNTHVYGSGAYKAPVLHLKRRAHGDLFDTYSDSFDEVWDRSRPLPTSADCYPRLDLEE